MADIQVKLVKSLIGSTKPQIATALIEVSEAKQGGAN